jgi:hypothetical protein
MNCHGNNENNQSKGNHKKGHILHILLMILCCAIPLLLFFVLPIFNIDNANLKNFMSGAILFLCPLMHLLMMPLMFGKDKDKEKEKDNTGFTENQINIINKNN